MRKLPRKAHAPAIRDAARLRRFCQVTAILRADYELTPEINAEIDEVARMLETLRKTRR
jgi:hypothetical protein